MTVTIKRVYEVYSKADGFRVLVDRLWPRGIKKEDAHIDLWLKEVAPSTELRKWFGHAPEKWETFKTAYLAALKGGAAFEELKTVVKQHATVTLVYAAKDEKHNNAVVLQQLLKKQNHE